MKISHLIAVLGFMACTFSVVAETPKPVPSFDPQAKALESCLTLATNDAAKAQPKPTVDAVMNHCSAQWAALQRVLPAAAYPTARDHAHTTIAQQLAATNSQR